MFRKVVMTEDSKAKMDLNIEDTVVVNADSEDLLIVSFLEAIYEDEKNYKQAREGVNKCFALIEKNKIDHPVNIIVDLRPMGNKSHISPNARDIYINFVSDPRIKKVAVLGSSDAQTSIANFVLSFDEKLKNKLAWFGEDTEAKFWING